MKDKFNRLWFQHFIKTPFCSFETFGNLWDMFEETVEINKKIFAQRDSIWQRLTKSVSTRERTFLAHPNDVNKLIDLFGHRQSDLIINSLSQNSLDILIRDMQNSHGNRVFMISVDAQNYPIIQKKLTSLGFVENVDFFNIAELSRTPEIFSHKLNIVSTRM